MSSRKKAAHRTPSSKPEVSEKARKLEDQIKAGERFPLHTKGRIRVNQDAGSDQGPLEQRGLRKRSAECGAMDRRQTVTFDSLDMGRTCISFA